MTLDREQWPYPGSRWWRFDFHTHTPASLDTPWAQQRLDLTPQQWLLKYMEAGIDCVAITDHNTGDWVDLLKDAYQQMADHNDLIAEVEGFRRITIFPGVEISVNGGFHILAVFDPSATSRDISNLLSKVGYGGNPGDSDGVTSSSVETVIQAIFSVGGIAIPAHADRAKGLLETQEGTRKLVKDTYTVKQALEVPGLQAYEWCDLESLIPEAVEDKIRGWAQVLGSDCHNFRGSNVPGSRYTWVKMAKPSLEGLRLALLDGNEVSIRRSDAEFFEPFKTPEQFITQICIKNARFMGRGSPVLLEFTPFYNALIGGRGTGKSTVAHALRLAYLRESDLQELSQDTEVRRQFEQFRKISNGRNSVGALRDDSEITVELMRDGIKHRLRWLGGRLDGVVEEQAMDGGWQPSASQNISSERFPIRIFSQNQIAAMAGENRQALLKVIDEAAGVDVLKNHLEDACNTWLSQRARLRDLKKRLSRRSEIERQRTDLLRKLETFAQSDHAEVLKAHQLAFSQQHEVESSQRQLEAMPDRILELAENLLLDEWAVDIFDSEKDSDILAWRSEAESRVTQARQELSVVAESLSACLRELGDEQKKAAWAGRVDKAHQDYDNLKSRLAEQGVESPETFGKLVQERQALEVQLNELQKLEEEHEQLLIECKLQWQEVVDARHAISEARANFLREVLEDSQHVKMMLVPFGYDALTMERELRAALDINEGSFSNDLMALENGEPVRGVVVDLSRSNGSIEAVSDIKRRLLSLDESLGGHFRNALSRKWEAPENIDRFCCWFPEDDLRIEFKRDGDQEFSPIHQGSPGQRAAALLAFLLAFGEEPLVLDQPEDDLDNHLIYQLIVQQIRENKQRRQIIIITHNPNVLVNGDAEMVYAFEYGNGQCFVRERGALQERALREEVCHVMEGGRDAFARRWARLGTVI